MKPARFSYEAPTTVEAALAALAQRRDGAKIIAGGQSLAPMMNMRLAQPAHLIDINGISELAGVRRDGEHLVVGALVRHHDLARDTLVRSACPLLAHAAATIGHYAIRQRGTFGGSLAHADPAAQLPLIAMLLDAEIEIASADGRRHVPAQKFFLGIFTTALEPHELLVGARFPILAPETGWGFRLFARRAGDFAIAAAGAVVSSAQTRIALGGVGPVPVRVDRLDAVEIEDSEGIPAEYRRELVAALVADVLADAQGRAR